MVPARFPVPGWIIRIFVLHMIKSKKRKFGTRGVKEVSYRVFLSLYRKCQGLGTCLLPTSIVASTVSRTTFQFSIEILEHHKD